MTIKLYTGGTFDIPHIGHAFFLEKCKQCFPDSHLTVALNRDEFVKRFKGSYPVFSYDEREENLRAISYVDEIIPNVGDEDSKITILSCRPDIIVIGNDWLEKNYCQQMNFDTQWLNEQRIALFFLPRYGSISSTLIKQRLSKKHKNDQTQNV